MGQHFLRDAGWQQRIYESLPRPDQETWIEVGAGHGEMTALLAKKAQRLVAIEGDERLAAELKERAAREWPKVEVVAGDVLNVELGTWMNDTPEGDATRGCRVYGNLPYYITSPILHRLFEWADRIASVHIVIQLEVAERILARPGRREYGYLSVACQYFAKPGLAMRIPPGAFRPPPKVTSALVHMTMPGERAAMGITDDRRFLDFVQTCFGHKRKTLRNNLLPIASDEHIRRVMAAYGVRPDARAEQLTLEQFGALFRELS